MFIAPLYGIIDVYTRTPKRRGGLDPPVVILICNQHRYHSGFVRVPSNGTEIAASGCEIARDLCDRMCLNIFK